MSEKWPYERISLLITAQDGDLTHRLHATGGNCDPDIELSNDAPSEYRSACRHMAVRNPDMTPQQIHHRVLMNWWEELGGNVYT